MKYLGEYIRREDLWNLQEREKQTGLVQYWERTVYRSKYLMDRWTLWEDLWTTEEGGAEYSSDETCLSTNSPLMISRPV